MITYWIAHPLNDGPQHAIRETKRNVVKAAADQAWKLAGIRYSKPMKVQIDLSGLHNTFLKVVGTIPPEELLSRRQAFEKVNKTDHWT